VLSIYEVVGIAMASLVMFLLLRPIGARLKGLGRVLLKSFVAFFGIWAVNIAGGFFGFHLGLNLISAITLGILGIPGAILLLAVKYLI
jgi:inhibitor of the pro-sigma K processing machinery